MKKRFFLIVSILFLFAAFRPVKATHLVGGEITWECIPSSTNAGKFIFRIKLYRACYVPAAGLNPTANIINPLYAQYGGTASITCVRISQVDLAKPCFNPNYQVVCGKTLASGGGSAVEEHIYLSAPVQINGVPDTNGSDFYWKSCCRPGLQNVIGAGYYLRSVMYPYLDPVSNTFRSLGSSTNGPTCFDSSPQFVAKPSVTVCGGQSVLYEHMTIDVNNDSIRYDWSVPLDSTQKPILWKTNYSTALQLPNKAHDTNNVNPVLDTNTGVISFKTYSPLNGYHSISVKATSYKKGQKVAEIYRDIVVTIINCNTISSSPKVYNTNRPSIMMKESTSSTYQPTMYISYPVGSNISLDIKVDDLDSLPTSPVSLQSVDLEIIGVSMSGSSNNNSNCLVAPCAYLDSNNISWNGTQFIDTSSLTVRFNWNTSCINLEDFSIYTGGYPYREFVFQVKSKDNWCPVPAEQISFFTIVLVDTNSTSWAPDSINASKGGGNISWPQFTRINFNSYELYRSYDLTTPWTYLTSIPNMFNTSYNDVNARTDSTSVFYLVEINNGPSCFVGYEVKSIYLEVNKFQNRSKLTWNLPYTDVARYTDGVYYIYRSDSINSWNLIDSTSFGTEYYLDSGVIYNKMMDYKIESKDLYGLYSTSNIDSLKIDSSITGIINNSIGEFKIYPNPANDLVTIELSIETAPYLLDIIDLQGSTQKQLLLKNAINYVDISELKPGLYFLRFKSEQNQEFYKMIVK